MSAASSPPPRAAWADATLRCVLSGQPVHREALTEWPHRHTATSVGTGPFEPVGLTDDLLVTADRAFAYPVVRSIPVLVAPEAFTIRHGFQRSVNDRRYAEAYQEAKLYGQLARASLESIDSHPSLLALRRIAQVCDEHADTFPDPVHVWLGRESTVAAQHQCFAHLMPLAGTTVLQLGGSGIHALLFLLAGAARAITVSPIIDELRLGLALSVALGLDHRFVTVAGFAEELPLIDGAVDRCYSGSSMHHTNTDQSFPEISRALTPSGRFSSVDVWDAPLHAVGTRVFGKADGNEFCRPMNELRVAPARHAFDDVDAAFHGSLARYPLSIAARVGWLPSRRMAWRLATWEDRVSTGHPFIAKHASIISLCCRKS